MLLFSSSSSPFVSSSHSRGPHSCSVFKVPVFFIAIILVTFTCSSSTVTGKQHSEKHKYYQTLQRHLKSFTVKDDPEDLLALPSDSGPSVAVVAPPPNFSRNGPITQYAQGSKSATATQEKSSSTTSSSSKKYKKWKSHRYNKSKNEEEDNIAQESNQGGVAAAYAAPPPEFSPSSKLLHRSDSSDNIAQESYQSAAYASPPPPPVSTSSLSAATAKSYDQYLRNSVRTASTKDNVAQESYQRDTYAPAPKEITTDNFAQESYQREAYAPAPVATTKDNFAQESYQRDSYAPAPKAITQDNVAQESYQRDSYASAPVTSTKDNYAQESYQRDSYAPAPAASSSSRDYDSYHRNNVDSSSTKTSDNQAEESYQRKEYAPAPPLPSPLSSNADPLIPPPPPTAEARRHYYDQYLRSRSSSSVTNDNQAQESYQAPISYASPEPSLSPSPAPAVSGKSVITYNDNQAQESYRTPLSYASPPPPPPPPQSSINYYPGHYPPSPPSSYHSQSGGVASSAPVPAYAPSNSYAASSNHDAYYHPPSSSHSPSSYYPENAVPHYAPYPATTPPPAIRAQYHRHMSYYPTQKPTILQPANKNVIASASSNQMQVSGSTLLSQHPHLMSIEKHQEEQKQNQQQTSYSSPAASNTPFGGYRGETFEFSPAPPGPPQSPSPPPAGTADSPTQNHDQSSEEDSLQNQQKLMWGALGLDYDLYRTALTTPSRLLGRAANLLSSLRIPRDHYMNVISFVGIYMFMSILLYKQDDLLHNKCDEDDEPYPKEWHYHVGRRFVPAVHKVDKKMQKKFLKLFKGIHLQDEDDGNGSSSEEDGPSIVNYVNEMCPKDAFFYSLAPMHLEARMQVQRILVAQPSPAHVYSAAKALLYKHKIHPKIWYLGLMAAALERPDMTGFKLAHPLDAIPDWFIPADLIQDEMDNYRSISLSRAHQKKRLRRAIAESGNSTKTTLTTTPRPSTTTTISSSTTTGASSNYTSSSTTTKITRKPLLFTRRSTTTYRPPSYSFFSGESGSYENFVLDGTPPHLKDKYNEINDYVPYDEEAINDSVQKYQEINKDSDGKYKPKKKAKPKKPPPSEDDKQEHEQDASNSASEEANTSNGIELIDLDASASVETEGDNANSSGASNEGNSAQQNDVPTNNDLATLDDEAALMEPAPPSVRPSHLTSSSHSHNAIKVGDLTVVVGSGPSLLNDPSLNDLDDIQTYNLLDEGDTGIVRTKDRKKHSHGHGHGHGHKKKGHKKGKGKGKDDGKCIIVDGKVGRDNGVENKLWYFREDMMVNQFHWYWHLQHPANATKHPDRRAELFFFTHRQFLARYNVERLSNGLHRMREMNNIGPGGILFEPYHSHLADVASGRYWTPRFPKRLLRDIRHEHDPDVGKNIMLRDVGKMYSRLVNSARTGILLSTVNGLTSIRNSQGIEPLANTIEATQLSVNPFIYDSFGLHNSGHLVIGLVEDPDWRYKKVPGVMSEVATAMRDPIFYNYHALVDNIVERHKETLSPYKVAGGEFPLLWKGIKILDIEMISKGNGPLNQLRTFWTKKKFELAPSVDASTSKDKHAKICAVHLAHEPFTFKITIEKRPCARTKSSKGTIRIFIAPRFDENGRRLHLKDQRRLMIQLDAFQAKLRIGTNIITRRSHDSSLTQPWTKHMDEFKKHDKSGAADFCGCGWPQHLYIPKGTRKGMPFDLFVMVTNYDEDHVPNHPRDLELPETCNSPYLLCGHPRRRYPDARPMGYPFDRPPYKTPIPCLQGHSFAAVVCKSFNLVVFKAIDTLEEFVAKAPNMKSIVFDIKHINKLVKHYHRRH